MHSLSVSTPPRLERRPAYRASPHRNINAARRVRLAQGTILPLRSTDAVDAFRILSGCVMLSQGLTDGRRQILDILGPGRLLHSSVTDLADCAAETLSPTHLERRKLLDPRASSELVDAALLMLRRSQHHATLLGRKTALERVAYAVLDLADQFGARVRGLAYAEVIFRLHLTRADLADWLGLTGETVSRCLNALKRQEIIGFDTPEIITIKNLKTLEAATGGERPSFMAKGLRLQTEP
jgi:CRP/FNR family transcriptional regulator